MWRIFRKDQAATKPYPILLMHGLLDCSASWFLHLDKYMDFDQGPRVCPTSSRLRATRSGSATTEATEYHSQNSTMIKASGIIVSTTSLTTTSQHSSREFLAIPERKSSSMWAIRRDPLSSCWEWASTIIYKIR